MNIIKPIIFVTLIFYSSLDKKYFIIKKISSFLGLKFENVAAPEPTSHLQYAKQPWSSAEIQGLVDSIKNRVVLFFRHKKINMSQLVDSLS